MRPQLFFDSLRPGRFLRGDAPVADTIRLSRRNIYILPSRDGLFFAVVLILMLIGSINYNNSLGYLLCFLLGSLSIVTILHTYKNLYRLEISMGEIRPVFCGQVLHIPLTINNLGGPARLALHFDFPDGELPAIHDIAANTQSDIILQHKTHHRGLMKPERLRISCRFPLGLFRTWSILNFTRTALVYPRPADSDRLPPEHAEQGHGDGRQGQGSDDFTGLRNYHPGDSLRHIHWKALAKEQGLLTKQFAGENNRELWLDWRNLPQLEIETRLSQLTRWVVDAHKNGIAYGLWIPATEIAVNRGDAHRHRCLRLLAEFGPAEADQHD